MPSGILYPAWPLPETERETGFLQSMKEGFQKKDAVLLGLYLQTAGRLHGYLEDAFIEEQMCRRFPGSIPGRGFCRTVKGIWSRFLV